MKRWFIRSAFILIVIVLVFGKRTDADLFDQEKVENNLFTVAKLDIANQDTANMQPKSSLFQITGLLPTGFQVESVRIKNDGDFPLPLSIQPTQLSGDLLCANLELTVLKNWQIVYQGTLNGFTYSPEVSPQASEDLVVALSFASNDSSLQQQSCTFGLLVKSTLNATETPLYDEELLQNQIVSGSW